MSLIHEQYDETLRDNAELRARVTALEGTVATLREALERAERKLTAYVGVCGGDKELTLTVLPMVRTALEAK